MTPETLALNLIPTYTVFSRHSANCPDANKGEEHVRCSCRKWLRVYDPRKPDPRKRQEKWSLKTRDAAEAERIAQGYRDKHDPNKVRAAEAEAKLEAHLNRQRAQSTAATVEEAVARFLVFKKDNPSRRSSRIAGRTADSTMEGYKHLLGNVDAKFEVARVHCPRTIYTTHCWITPCVSKSDAERNIACLCDSVQRVSHLDSS